MKKNEPKLQPKCPRCLSKNFKEKACSDCNFVSAVDCDELGIPVGLLWYAREIENVVLKAHTKEKDKTMAKTDKNISEDLVFLQDVFNQDEFFLASSY